MRRHAMRLQHGPQRDIPCRQVKFRDGDQSVALSSAEMRGQRSLPLLPLHFLTSVASALSIVVNCAIRSRTIASFSPAIFSTSWQ